MKKKYVRPQLSRKKIRVSFLTYSPRSLSMRNGINQINLLDEGVTLASCCGTCCDPSSCDCVSDKRLKKEIKELPSLSKKIADLNCVSYKWKQEAMNEHHGSSPRYGLLAQDVEKVFPNLVHTHQGVKTIDYTGVITVLLQSIQEMQKKQTKLQEEIAALKNN